MVLKKQHDLRPLHRPDYVRKLLLLKHTLFPLRFPVHIHIQLVKDLIPLVLNFSLYILILFYFIILVEFQNLLIPQNLLNLQLLLQVSIHH